MPLDEKRSEKMDLLSKVLNCSEEQLDFIIENEINKMIKISEKKILGFESNENIIMGNSSDYITQK